MADKARETWTAEKVRVVQSVMQDVISLNTKIGIDENSDTELGDTELGDMIADTAPTPEELVLKEFREETVRKWVSTVLSPREEKIVSMRYGLEDGEYHTLEEVGNAYGLTRERIRQIDARAIHKLKAYCGKNHIKLEDLY